MKFSGGSVGDYRDVLHIHCQSERLIAGAKRRGELRHCFVALQTTEAFDGVEDSSGHPAYHHLSSDWEPSAFETLV